MTENKHYTRQTRHTYDPGPCEQCGGHNVTVKWVQTSTYGDTEDQFIPGTRHCPDCAQRRP